MAHPLLFGVLAVIPGLGLLALKEYKGAALAFFGLIGLAIYTMFFSSDSAFEFLFDATIGSWFFQIWFTYQIAQRKYKQESGELNVIPRDEIVAPKHLSFKEKKKYWALEETRGQLRSGENLITAMWGIKANAIGGNAYKSHFVGITDKELILIDLDISVRPINITRIPLTGVSKIKIGNGLINRKVQIFVEENKSPHKILVSKIFYEEQIAQLKEIFEKYIR